MKYINKFAQLSKVLWNENKILYFLSYLNLSEVCIIFEGLLYIYIYEYIYIYIYIIIFCTHTMD